MNLEFEKAKLKRFITTHGAEYTFSKAGKNDFGEPQGEASVSVVKGVYHETQGYVTQSGADASTTKTKPQSLIMCSKEDSTNLSSGMTLQLKGKTYKLVDIRDVNQLGVAVDLSLEVVL